MRSSRLAPLWLGVVSMLTACSLNLVTPIPTGTGTITVVIRDDEGHTFEDLEVELSVNSLLARSRFGTTSTTKPLEFPNLGPAEYALRIVNVPPFHVAEPAARLISISEDRQREVVEFTLRAGAELRVSLESSDQSPSALIVLPESLLSGCLSKQSDWILKNRFYLEPSIPGSFDSSELCMSLPASTESLRMVLGGFNLWNFGLMMRWSPDGAAPWEENASPVITEAILVHNIGPTTAGSTFRVGPLTLPDISAAPIVLQGHVRDTTGQPIPWAILSVVPRGEGMGNFIIADSSGRYEIRGLPAGEYRISMLGRVGDRLKEQTTEARVTDTRREIDLTFQ